MKSGHQFARNGLVSEVANYVLYHSIAKVQRNELFQKGFLIDGIKCLRIVNEY